MEYHYPAEFIVPTYVPFDTGPIGKTFETEFEHEEMPVGLQFCDMLNGILVTGGTATQRFITNFTIVFEAALAEKNYLIITTTKHWRRLLDLVEHATYFRLGEDLTLNVTDPEDTEVSEYTSILSQAFAQAFQLSREGIESIHQTIITLLASSQIPVLEELKMALETKSVQPRGINRELVTVYQFLQNIGHGAAAYISGATMLSFRQLMRGITIIEIDLKVQQQEQFFLLCLLAKALAHAQTQPNTSCMILVDNADPLAPLNPYSYRSNESEQYLMEWGHRFRQCGLGLHLSMKTPSRFPIVILNNFSNILALKTNSYQDIKVVRDLLQFLPDRMVHSNQRHDNYQVEFLKTLPNNTLILKRNDIPNAFPIQITPTDFTNTHLWSEQELRVRLHQIYPNWIEPIKIAQTIIEQDFGLETPIIEKVLSLLEEYPELGKQGLLSSLNSQPNIELDMPQFERLLIKMRDYNYIVVTEHDDGRGHRHHSYRLTEKGRQVFEQYLDSQLDNESISA